MTRWAPLHCKVQVGVDWPWLLVRNAAGELETAVVEYNLTEGWFDRYPTGADGKRLFGQPVERVVGPFSVEWKDGAPQP